MTPTISREHRKIRFPRILGCETGDKIVLVDAADIEGAIRPGVVSDT